MTSAAAGIRVLHLKHTVPARRDRVFRAFTDVVELKKWWGPKGFTMPAAELDLRVGGKYRYEMKAPDGEAHVVVGTFQLVEPPAKLVKTWQWEGDDLVTTVTLLFHDRGASTEIELYHEGFAEVESVERHSEGWSSCFERLGELYAR